MRWHRHHHHLHAHLHPPPGGWRRLRHELRLYYGAHLHRRLFWWFGAAIFLTIALVTVAARLIGPGGGPARALIFLGLPALALWTLSGKIARRIARPLFELVVVAKEVGRGNLGARAQRACGGFDEIATLAHALNDMAARIERQLADQRELLAAVSHELRTPLGHLRVLIDIGREQGAGPRTFDELERELLEMDRLVGELLASARLDFGVTNPRPITVVDAALRALERAGLPPDKLVAEGAAGARIEGDPTLLGRALANLIDNAQKHGRGLETLRVEAQPAAVLVHVDDRGPGFTPEAQARLFQPFAGTESGRQGRDTSLGLGLSLVARIARAHGGSVTAENRAEGGARVTLTLKAAAAPSHSTPAA